MTIFLYLEVRIRELRKPLEILPPFLDLEYGLWSGDELYLILNHSTHTSIANFQGTSSYSRVSLYRTGLIFFFLLLLLLIGDIENDPQQYKKSNLYNAN